MSAASSALTPIVLDRRELTAHKAVVDPSLRSRNVLTKSPWTYVGLWLKRHKLTDAHFYWQHACEFQEAARGLPLESAPLLLYYCFLNAAKALLVSKRVTFSEWHGVTGDKAPRRKVVLSNEKVQLKAQGVAPALCQYFGDTELQKKHTLQALLYNTVFVHRTYCLTYRSHQDMFVPLKRCSYELEPSTNNVFLTANLSKNVDIKAALRRLPPSFTRDTSARDKIRSKDSVHWANPRKPTASDLRALAALHRRLRLDVHYINGAQTLWYLKGISRNPARIARYSVPVVFMAMHRLSEICRYNPISLTSLLEGQTNWLLSEFIQSALEQFVDEVASEITGEQFLVPNVRSPTQQERRRPMWNATSRAR